MKSGWNTTSTETPNLKAPKWNFLQQPLLCLILLYGFPIAKPKYAPEASAVSNHLVLISNL